MEKKVKSSINASPLAVKKSIYKQLISINIVLFLFITIIIFATMFAILNNITTKVSKDYAKLYAHNAVGTLDTYLKSEIALITKTANSNAIIDWFSDENNKEKKQLAYDEIMGILSVSSSQNIYLVIHESLNEYTIESHSAIANNYMIEDLKSHSVLSKDFPKDDWYFACISNEKNYLLNVDIDKVYNQKLVWLNYKVSRDGINYGAICIGLEFSKVIENLFSEYDSQGVQSLIIDEEGNIQMDSALFGDEDFLYTLDVPNIKNEFSSPTFLNTLNEYIKPMDYYYTSESPVTVLELSDEDYQYVTIAPIASTTWAVITFYNSSALFSLSNLIPVFIIVPITFILFILLVNGSISTLILRPLNYLINSIEKVNNNFNDRVYGLERKDEIGLLANTIQNMKDSLIDALSKLHYDALTSIYNRRYFDENINKLTKTLSRDKNFLSVLLLDIDHFKEFNDTYGHAAGDECLRKVASILSECITRNGDFVARYGGEEFIIVLPNTDVDGATNIAKRILTSFKKAAIPHEASNVKKYLTVSIGISTMPVTEISNSEDYILQSDKALYISKMTGRNRYTIYNE